MSDPLPLDSNYVNICFQDAVKLFLSKCEATGLAVFIIEPSLLRAVRESSLRRVELWNQEHHDSVAFGVIEPGLDKLVGIVHNCLRKVLLRYAHFITCCLTFVLMLD